MSAPVPRPGLPAEPAAEPAAESTTEFGRHVVRSARRLAGFEGYFFHRIGYAAHADANPSADTLEFVLVDGPGKPDVIVELAGVLTFEVTVQGELSGTFADVVTVRHLGPYPAPWPPEAMEHRSGNAQELVQMRLDGPTRVHAIARQLTVYVSEPYSTAAEPPVKASSSPGS